MFFSVLIFLEIGCKSGSMVYLPINVESLVDLSDT